MQMLVTQFVRGEKEKGDWTHLQRCNSARVFCPQRARYSNRNHLLMNCFDIGKVKTRHYFPYCTHSKNLVGIDQVLSSASVMVGGRKSQPIFLVDQRTTTMWQKDVFYFIPIITLLMQRSLKIIHLPLWITLYTVFLWEGLLCVFPHRN